MCMKLGDSGGILDEGVTASGVHWLGVAVKRRLGGWWRFCRRKGN